MTAIPDVVPQSQIPETPHMVDGRRWMIRGARQLAGAALVLAAMGLWVQPGAQLDADLLLIKFALSLVMGFAGLAVVQAGLPEPAISIEIDTVRREVRLVRGQRKSRTLVSRTKMADLGAAEQNGTMTRLWAADGTLIAEVALTDAEARASLLAALRDAGKL